MDKRLRILLLLVLLGFNLFYGLGGIPLLDPDEPVYAETAREMIQFNDYTSPRIFNDFWYDKPPMYYWLVAGTFNAFGVSDFSARFPSACMGVATILMFYYAVKRLFDEETGFWSSLVLGTSLEFFYLGKAAVTDMTLLFFMTGAILAFLNNKFLLMYIMMGLATVTKGPIGIVFPGAIIFLYFLASGEWRILKKMHIPLGVVIYFLVAGPWYYFMYQIHGQIFFDTFFGFHNMTRFTTAEHPERVLWYYYIPVLLVGLFPWTGMLFDALKKSITESSGTSFKNLMFMHIWWIFVFLFFSISKTKLVSYIFPLFPPLAVIIGWNIVRVSRERFPGREFSLAIPSLIMFIVLAAVWFFGGQQLPEMSFGAIVLAGITLLLAIGMVIAFLHFKDALLASWLHVVAGILTMFVVFTFMLPSVSGRFSVKTASDYYLENCDKGIAVHVDKFLRPGFMYYANVPGTEMKPETSDFADLLKTGGAKYIVVRGLEYRRLAGVEKNRLQLIFNENDIYIFKLE